VQPVIKFERLVRRSGGSLAVVIPPELQRAVGLKEGRRVAIFLAEDGKIVVELL